MSPEERQTACNLLIKSALEQFDCELRVATINIVALGEPAGNDVVPVEADEDEPE